MSALITADIFDQAVRMVRAAIEKAVKMGIANKLAGHFVVLNPSTGDILYQFSLDINHEKAQKYREIALSKAKVSWNTGLPSREVQQSEPYLYEVGDTKYGGSVVRGNGKRKLIVAFSGVQAVFDEMYASWLADAIIALCREAMDEVMKDEECDFLAA